MTQLNFIIAKLSPFLQILNISAYILQTVNPNVCINAFSCPTDEVVTEFLTQPHPHVEIGPTLTFF